MFGKKKLKALISSVTISICLLTSCQEQESNQEGFEIHGETQGTTYSIIIAEESLNVNKAQIDSLFSAFDLSLSTYIDESVISKLNASTTSISIADATGYFAECYRKSSSIYSATNGLFDPSVFPLVEGWGFMNDMETPLSKPSIDSILQFVSYEDNKLHHVDFKDDTIHFEKKHPNFKLDFNAIAQGLSVDVVDRFLKEHGHENYYIEIGGELILRGKNRDGENWKIGVDVPKDNLTTRKLENVLNVSDVAVATSGNYRKFYVIDGVKYAHTLNPRTGFPVQHSLLSATVVTDDCAKADAYATAFMVMGTENSLTFLDNHKDLNIEVYLLYADEKGEVQRKMSPGFSKYLKE